MSEQACKAWWCLGAAIGQVQTMEQGAAGDTRLDADASGRAYSDRQYAAMADRTEQYMKDMQKIAESGG